MDCYINEAKRVPIYWSYIVYFFTTGQYHQLLVLKFYISPCFKYSPEKQIFNHLEPVCFVYPQNCRQNLLAMEKINPRSLRPQITAVLQNSLSKRLPIKTRKSPLRYPLPGICPALLPFRMVWPFGRSPPVSDGPHVCILLKMVVCSYQSVATSFSLIGPEIPWIHYKHPINPSMRSTILIKDKIHMTIIRQTQEKYLLNFNTLSFVKASINQEQRKMSSILLSVNF